MPRDCTSIFLVYNVTSYGADEWPVVMFTDEDEAKQWVEEHTDREPNRWRFRIEEQAAWHSVEQLYEAAGDVY